MQGFLNPVYTSLTKDQDDIAPRAKLDHYHHSRSCYLDGLRSEPRDISYTFPSVGEVSSSDLTNVNIDCVSGSQARGSLPPHIGTSSITISSSMVGLLSIISQRYTRNMVSSLFMLLETNLLNGWNRACSPLLAKCNTCSGPGVLLPDLQQSTPTQ